MRHLDLSPLPCVDSGEYPRPMADAAPGFVDDSVVWALLAGVAGNRAPGNIELLTLSADQMDYAGWPPLVRAETRLVLRACG